MSQALRNTTVDSPDNGVNVYDVYIFVEAGHAELAAIEANWAIYSDKNET